MGSGACVFCLIVRGEVPAEIVHRDERVVAFLDINPLFRGHTLIVPAHHVETLGDLPPPELPGFFSLVQRVARAVEVALQAQGTFVGINNRISQSVPHLHAHVVPRRKGDGLRGFFWPRVHYESDAERQSTCEAIARALAAEPAPQAGPAHG